jgi:hypothetical protein
MQSRHGGVSGLYPDAWEVISMSTKRSDCMRTSRVLLTSVLGAAALGLAGYGLLRSRLTPGVDLDIAKGDLGEGGLAKGDLGEGGLAKGDLGETGLGVDLP